MSKGRDKSKKNKKKPGLLDGLTNMFKKKSRKKPEEDGDRSLSRNQVGGSAGSLGSMDEREQVDDFFSSKWSVPTHKQPSSPALKSKQAKLDLNAVSTTSALSNEGAKHKLAVKQNNKRPRSQYKNGRRPRSPGAPISPLAKVSEEEPPRAESPLLSDTEDHAPTPDKDEEELDKRNSIYPPKASEKQPESDSESESENEVQPKPIVHHVKPEIHEVKPEVHEVKVEDNKENVEPEEIKEEPKVENKPEPKREEPKKEEPPPVKKEFESKKEVIKKDENEPPSNPFGVVKLRSTGKRSNLDSHGTLRADKVKDASKRQTIAGDSTVHTVFAGSKVAQRSSVHEPKDWEKLESKLETKKEPEPEADSGDSEFSKVFSKLRKRNSTTITALVEADQKSPDRSSVKESKPIVTEAKPVVTREVKPAAVKEDPKPEPKHAEPPKSELKAEEPKTERPKTERPRSISPGSTDSNKKTEKPVHVAESPKDSDKDKTEPFKRDSPLLRDRERSKTIGTPPTTQKNETKSSPIVKRTHSQKVIPTTTATSNAPQTTEPEKRPALKPAARVEPKKPEETSNTGGQPSWIAMARKKTTTWDENRDPEKEMKEQSNKAKKEDDDENRKSKVMDLMKNFQIAEI